MLRAWTRSSFVVLESGESQLFMQQMDGHSRSAVLCGPLWVDNEVVGVLYLDGPMHNRTHRGVFDVFCNQAARLLTNEYVM
jgi:hypothetical protein